MTGIRVIAGSAKGRKLRMVPGGRTRPISDRVKEALFNILRTEIQGTRWLDLFAGTGSVGIEALSRGASWVVFTENDRKAVETIRMNLELTKLEERAEIQKVDAFDFLRRGPQESFDYIYIAPPQYSRFWSKAVKMVDEIADWIYVNGLMIAQMHPKEYEILALNDFVEFDQRKYGNTLLAFYERISD